MPDEKSHLDRQMDEYAIERTKAQGYRVAKLQERGWVPVVVNAPEFGEMAVYEITEER